MADGNAEHGYVCREFGKTRLTLLAVPIHATPQELKSFGEGKVYLEKGLAGTFDQLAEYLGKG